MQQIAQCAIYNQLMISEFQSINAHSRCEIMSILLLEPSLLASIGLDSHLRLWDVNTFNMLEEKRFNYSYLTAMASNNKDFIIGNENGELVFMDRSSMKVREIAKVHNDCITDIFLEEDMKILTCGNDGAVARMDLRKLKGAEKVELGLPLKQIVKFKGRYFIAGMKSFEMKEELEAKEYHQSQKFLQLGEKLFGTNDELGLYCASKYYVTHFPCENMIQFSSGILGSSESTLSFFSTHPSSSRISFKSERMSQLASGQSFLSLATSGSRVFAGSDCGSIHSFRLEL